MKTEYIIISYVHRGVKTEVMGVGYKREGRDRGKGCIEGTKN